MSGSTRTLLVAALLPLSITAAHAESLYARDAIFVRADADLGSEILQTLPQGSELEILGRDGQFLRVEAAESGTQGYVLKNMLTSPPEPSTHQLRARVNVNLREHADLDSRIVAVLKPEQDIDVLGTSGEFVQVQRKTDNAVGFVRRRMLVTAAGQ